MLLMKGLLPALFASYVLTFEIFEPLGVCCVHAAILDVPPIKCGIVKTYLAAIYLIGLFALVCLRKPMFYSSVYLFFFMSDIFQYLSKFPPIFMAWPCKSRALRYVYVVNGTKHRLKYSEGTIIPRRYAAFEHGSFPVGWKKTEQEASLDGQGQNWPRF
jgi:hypothetical protein